MIQLGLIGSGISRSSAPRLHVFLGELYGVPLDYRRIDSELEAGFDFAAALARCAKTGFRGVNVTHPFKEEARRRVQIADPSVARIGAINTVTFDAGGWQGTNTDYTGFAQAFRNRFGDAAPGTVVIAGAGGVSKAMGFALGQLGVTRIQLFDVLQDRAVDLAAALTAAGIAASAVDAASFTDAVKAADGLINGTPIGMWKSPGNPFPKSAVGGQRWAFDAVYTPLETEFLKDARTHGLDILSGYDLFLFQGFDAFTVFTGVQVDPADAMRKFPLPPQPN